GFTDSFDVVLTKQPNATVTVTMAVHNAQVTLSSTVLTFTPANWNVRQTVTITAPNDAVVEGFHTDSISFTVTSADTDTVETQGLTGVQDIPADQPTTFVLLAHNPLLTGPITVMVGPEVLAPNRFTISGNTLTFVDANGTPEPRVGNVQASYQYREAGYDGTFVK